MSGKYKRYPRVFREEAVKLVVEGSRPIADVAREIGVIETTLGSRTCAYREAHVIEGPELQLSEPAQLRQLERRNRELEMENA